MCIRDRHILIHLQLCCECSLALDFFNNQFNHNAMFHFVHFSKHVNFKKLIAMNKLANKFLNVLGYACLLYTSVGISTVEKDSLLLQFSVTLVVTGGSRKGETLQVWVVNKSKISWNYVRSYTSRTVRLNSYELT